MNAMTIRVKRLSIIGGGVAGILLIPFIAMQFTQEVNWSPIDFLIAGVLLFAVGMLIGVTVRKIKESRYRILLIASIILLFILLWAEMAVGIFGSPIAGS